MTFDKGSNVYSNLVLHTYVTNMHGGNTNVQLVECQSTLVFMDSRENRHSKSISKPKVDEDGDEGIDCVW